MSYYTYISLSTFRERERIQSGLGTIAILLSFVLKLDIISP